MYAIYLVLYLCFNINIKLSLNFIVIILKYCILFFNIYLLISMYINNWNNEL